MLDRIVRIIQLYTGNADLPSLALPDHTLQPVWCDHTHIVVQAEDILSLCKGIAKIVQCRIVESGFPVYDTYVVFSVDFFIVIKRFLLCAVVFDDDDLIMMVSRFLFDGIQTLLQGIPLILIRDQDRYQRLSLYFVFHAVKARKLRIRHFCFFPASVNMLQNRTFSRIIGIFFAQRIIGR